MTQLVRSSVRVCVVRIVTGSSLFLTTYFLSVTFALYSSAYFFSALVNGVQGRKKKAAEQGEKASHLKQIIWRLSDDTLVEN